MDRRTLEEIRSMLRQIEELRQQLDQFLEQNALPGLTDEIRGNLRRVEERATEQTERALQCALVTFINGVQKVYDCDRVINLERFQLLKNEAFFKAVTVDPGGYGVSWDDSTDLSEYELWNNGVEVEPSAAWSKGEVAHSEECVVQQVERG